ncbi:hypothetical protein [Marinobacter salarius]|uniref:Uncharacterized protein n=1 Tax=Marinobacter salarius TaxID=1420917 RepID=A0A1W6KFB2_9GAMM|nr:hypothetical protein [Marinobacter salarius]ARM86124.1 hypothetical protein MARSALSMR5_04104 [Marinobacter salarius]
MSANLKSIYNLSKDYGKLFRLICEGQRIAAWSDTFRMKDAEGNPYRDICEVRRSGEYEIIISARGTGYGNVWPFMKDEGTEEDVFVKVCKGCNLEWIDPSPDTRSSNQLNVGNRKSE